MSPQVTSECNYCDDDFEHHSSKVGKFCSKECHNKSMSKKVDRKCENCGKDYRSKPSRRKKYCCHDCYVEHTSKDKIDKTCQECSKDFEVLPSEEDKKYCSRECYRSAEFVQDYPTIECDYCGEEVAVNPCNKDRRRFCSQSCYLDYKEEFGIEDADYGPDKHTEESKGKIGEANSGEDHYMWKGGKVEIECEECGDYRLERRHRAKSDGPNFCSRECYHNWFEDNYDTREDTPIGKSGEEHHNWAGGGEYPPEWTVELKDRVRDRDDLVCQECGISQAECIKKYGFKLPVHHIDGDKQNCKMSNLKSLCPSCHAQAHEHFS